MHRPLLALLFLLSACPAASPPQRPVAPPPATPVERDRPDAARPAGRPVPVTFAGFFEPRTLRIDLTHEGNRTQETYRVDALVREGAWAGSTTKLVDPLDYGVHRFEIRDAATTSLLYTRTYASIFQEWQTTDEAKVKRKGFSESLRLPLPRAAFELTIFSRVPSTNGWREVFRKALDPRGGAVTDWKADPALVPVVLHESGPASRRLDILILGDGYTAAEKEKFLRDARRFTQTLLEDPSFGAMKGRYNVRALFAPSLDSGVSEPRKGLNRRTALGLSFNTFDSERYLMTEANLDLRRLAAHAPYEALYLMANTSRYGGGGIYNLYATFPSDNEYDAYVFIHEFGHSFGGLGDEYYDSDTAYSDMYPRGVEPWEPNLTAFLKGVFKWKALVTPGTPIPTPHTVDREKGVVGLFEGAGYAAKELFRPQWNCKMKGKGHVPFCKVCGNGVARMIELYAE
jgi:hypothetical protein